MDSLSEFDLQVLEHLPCEPTALSLAELADGLLDSRGPRDKGLIRRALDDIARALGGLTVGKGNDDFGGFAVSMYAIPRETMPLVRAFFAEIVEHAS